MGLEMKYEDSWHSLAFPCCTTEHKTVHIIVIMDFFLALQCATYSTNVHIVHKVHKRLECTQRINVEYHVQTLKLC